MADLLEQEWIELCQQAAIESNPNELLELVVQINGFLEKRVVQLKERWICSKLNDSET